MDIEKTNKAIKRLFESQIKEKKESADKAKELGIKSIWDNGGLTADRYTIVLNSLYNEDIYPDMYNSLALNADPSNPEMGFSQFTGAREGKHLGKQMKFNELPENIQNHVIERLKEEPGLEGEEPSMEEPPMEEPPMEEPAPEMEPEAGEPEEKL